MGRMTIGEWLLEWDNEIRARHWMLPDDPMQQAYRKLEKMMAWANPMLPQQDSPHVRWRELNWERPVYDGYQPTVRPTFTAQDWTDWWSRLRGPQFPLSWHTHYRRFHQYQRFMGALAVEQRGALITAATGRIMGLHHRGGHHGLRKLQRQDNPTSGPVRRRDRAKVRHRG